MREYIVDAESSAGGDAAAYVKQSTVNFDASAEDKGILPNPAELLLMSFSACVLKNVERYSQRLHLPYRKARIKVKGYRTDVPPVIIKIEYVLEIDTDVEDKKLSLWHKNILKFGTITNTMMRAAEVTGEIKRMNKDE
jgi:uncharacterized OsmC-like protein